MKLQTIVMTLAVLIVLAAFGLLYAVGVVDTDSWPEFDGCWCPCPEQVCNTTTKEK